MSQYTYFENTFIKPTVVLNCRALVFLSSTLYALCIATKRYFVNQNKGKITFIIFPWDRVSLATSWLSGSFQWKTVANKKVKMPSK